jgi:hypothetical protein
MIDLSSINVADFNNYTKPFLDQTLKQISVGVRLARVGYFAFSDQILTGGWMFNDVLNQSVSFIF